MRKSAKKHFVLKIGYLRQTTTLKWFKNKSIKLDNNFTYHVLKNLHTDFQWKIKVYTIKSREVAINADIIIGVSSVMMII